MELGKVKLKRFADGEIYCQIGESVRGCDVFLIQPSCPPVNDHLMELLIMIDACKRASARSVTAVIPYYGYARADRKTQGRESIAAKLSANLITEAGADRCGTDLIHVVRAAHAACIALYCSRGDVCNSPCRAILAVLLACCLLLCRPPTDMYPVLLM
jgi:ribose-phosphate pyrophosphokinase